MGYSATGSTSFVATASTPVTAVAKQLPAGHFTAAGNVYVTVFAVNATEFSVTCRMVDQPVRGAATTVALTWPVVADYDSSQLPNQGTLAIPFAAAIETSTSSTLSINCERYGYVAPHTEIPVEAGSMTATVTAGADEHEQLGAGRAAGEYRRRAHRPTPTRARGRSPHRPVSRATTGASAVMYRSGATQYENP